MDKPSGFGARRDGADKLGNIAGQFPKSSAAEISKQEIIKARSLDSYLWGKGRNQD